MLRLPSSWGTFCSDRAARRMPSRQKPGVTTTTKKKVNQVEAKPMQLLLLPSVTGVARCDTNGSRHWVKASKPQLWRGTSTQSAVRSSGAEPAGSHHSYLRVTAAGVVTVSSGSTNATAGIMNSDRRLTLTPCSGDNSTAFLVTSAPVPAQ